MVPLPERLIAGLREQLAFVGRQQSGAGWVWLPVGKSRLAKQILK